jgi:hypothetical protein
MVEVIHILGWFGLVSTGLIMALGAFVWYYENFQTSGKISVLSDRILGKETSYGWQFAVLVVLSLAFVGMATLT